MRIVVYRDKSGQWRWRAVAANGRIVADGSEGYASRRNARRAADAVRAAMSCALIVLA